MTGKKSFNVVKILWFLSYIRKFIPQIRLDIEASFYWIREGEDEGQQRF
jgi:hypothetical protein